MKTSAAGSVGASIGSPVGGGGTEGSVLFIGAGGILAQDNANLFWENTAKRLGIGVATPSQKLHVKGTGLTGSRVESSSTSDPDHNAFQEIVSQGAGGSAFVLFNVVGGAIPQWSIGAYNPDGEKFTIARAGALETNRDFTIDSAGNIGIGQTGPTQRLHVNGNVLSDRTGADAELQATRNSGSTTKIISGAGAGIVGTTSNHQLLIQANAATAMYVAPGGNVTVGSAAPNAAAKLQVDSTVAGFLPPRMTTAQRDAIGTPPAGLIIYNTDVNVFNFYNGTIWGVV